MASRRIYWDSCVWIGLINDEADKADACKYVIEQAESGSLEVWTSTLSLAEVFKKKCDGVTSGIEAAADANFEDFLLQNYVVRVQVDADVGLLARRLLRKYPKLAKPADAIHLATALLNNLDEFHTFDGDNLLSLDGIIARKDGQMLKICVPPKRPDPNAGTLFEVISDEDRSAAGAA